MEKWSLDMKLEAMVPSIIETLKAENQPALQSIRTDVTAHIGTVINVDLSKYK